MANEIEDRWAALAAQFPPSVAPTPTGIDDEVHPGQLREAIWGDVEATVLIIEVDDENAEVTVNPVSLEPGVADEHSLLLAAEAVPLRSGISVWPHVTAILSFVVLDGLVAELPADAMSVIRRSPSTARSESYQTTGSGPRFGTDPLPGSGAALAIDDLLDSVDGLVAIRPARHHRSSGAQKPSFPLGLSDLITTLGVTQSEAMSIIRGKRALTPDQAELVARAANVPTADVTAAALPLPEELERELMEPRWRAVIRQRSGPRDETEAREELGRSAFALAARDKGTGRELWRQRIQAVLVAESA